MGVDVNMYVLGTATDEELAEAEKYMEARVGGMAWGHPETRPLLRRADYPDLRIELDTGSRYYGPGYERGHWPTIAAAILCMRVAFGGRDVYYGGDTTDDGLLADDNLLTAYWLHFLGPDGDSYHDRRH